MKKEVAKILEDNCQPHKQVSHDSDEEKFKKMSSLFMDFLLIVTLHNNIYLLQGKVVRVLVSESKLRECWFNASKINTANCP